MSVLLPFSPVNIKILSVSRFCIFFFPYPKRNMIQVHESARRSKSMKHTNEVPSISYYFMDTENSANSHKLWETNSCKKKKKSAGTIGTKRDDEAIYPTFLHVEINLPVTLPGFCMANKGSFHPTTAQHTGVFSLPPQTRVVNRAQGTLALTLMK